MFTRGPFVRHNKTKNATVLKQNTLQHYMGPGGSLNSPDLFPTFSKHFSMAAEIFPRHANVTEQPSLFYVTFGACLLCFYSLQNVC